MEKNTTNRIVPLVMFEKPQNEGGIDTMTLKEQGIKDFAFDMDGTLVDSKGRILEGVVDNFQAILRDVPDAKISIVTASTPNIINVFVDNVNKEFRERGIEFKFKPYIASCLGARIEDPDGKLLFNKTLKPSLVKDIANRINIVEENKFLLYVVKDSNYYNLDVLNSKEKVLMPILKIKQAQKGYAKFEAFASNTDELEKIVNNNEILGLYILGLSSDSVKEIHNALKTIDLQGSYVDKGSVVKVTNSNKLNAIKFIYGDDLSKVVYIGDGRNDIEALKACGNSIAVGTNVEVLKSAQFPIIQIKDVYETMTSSIVKKQAIKDNLPNKIIEADNINKEILEAKEKKATFKVKQMIKSKKDRKDHDKLM